MNEIHASITRRIATLSAIHTLIFARVRQDAISSSLASLEREMSLRVGRTTEPPARPPNLKLEAAQRELHTRLSRQQMQPISPPPVDTFGEKHFSVKTLAERFGVHSNTIIRAADKQTSGVRWVGQKKRTRMISESAARRMFPG